ncbi:hypothetical protein LZ554_006046 [Drepanopeziza brunnea f. sp. 'monogermtubi']|nr:hypothetical protein LZ554_006046 [Drepanopeziza brunnea f. sp. 'monogermtubi']
MTTPNPFEIIHAYRHLYRGLLHAVQYSKPARYLARDQLRIAFRKDDPSTFNKAKVHRTIEFLKYAAQERGLEHRIVKSLLHTKYCEVREAMEANRLMKTAQTPLREKIMKTSRINYRMTLAMLNDSMGLCLR